jgi:hypothetical protein
MPQVPAHRLHSLCGHRWGIRDNGCPHHVACSLDLCRGAPDLGEGRDEHGHPVEPLQGDEIEHDLSIAPGFGEGIREALARQILPTPSPLTTRVEFLSFTMS